MTTLEHSLDEPVIPSSDDGASVKPSHNTRLSIPPLPLPLPHVMHGTNTNVNASVTKKNELRSSGEQPLRFLANSVSISVTNSANNQKPVADVSRDVSTESRKKENLMISSSVSCINPHDIQQVCYIFCTIKENQEFESFFGSTLIVAETMSLTSGYTSSCVWILEVANKKASMENDVACQG